MRKIISAAMAAAAAIAYVPWPAALLPAIAAATPLAGTPAPEAPTPDPAPGVPVGPGTYANAGGGLMQEVTIPPGYQLSAGCTLADNMAIAAGSCLTPLTAPIQQTPVGGAYVPANHPQAPVGPPPAVPAPPSPGTGGGNCNFVSPGNNTDAVNALCGAASAFTGR